jgi:hypothetical protein
MPYRAERWSIAAALVVVGGATVVVMAATGGATGGKSAVAPAQSAAVGPQQGSKRLTQPFPSPRTGAAMAYDAFRHEVVLFGGLSGPDSSPALSDTWTLQGRQWTKRDPVIRPGPLAFGHMVYDDRTHSCMLIWPGSGGGPTATWSWNGTSWIRFPDVPLGATEILQAVASDPTTGHVLLISLVGAANDGSPSQTRTWTWDGGTWALRQPLHSLPVSGSLLTLASVGASAQGRLGRGIVAVFGAADANLPPQTWVWDGSTWSQALAATTPPDDPLGTTMAEDPSTEELVLIAGSPAGGNGSTWVWDGTGWHQAGAAPLVNSGDSGETAMSDGASAHAMLIGERSPDSQSTEFDVLWTFDGHGWVTDRPA